ncbi:F-box protein At3g54460 [Impatiens glandulifera]|uniref:F-box protein At3g54460 n=1 Tax=Impatiens glandulifera TaxID=253017 RepID=UPI001FB0530B|nr:F-box protein At3g54460 [Impatiens glandulifera]
MAEDDDSPTSCKLCGFLCAVLAVAPTHRISNIREALPLNTRCFISGDGNAEIGFRSENDLFLSLVNPARESADEREKGSASASWKKKCMKRIGLVNGSMSVIHQLHTLVIQRCLDIVARVVRVAEAVDNAETDRVVLLIDVYLPNTLWSGWQFPKFGSVAAALFRHLSCDWGERSELLSSTSGNSPTADHNHHKGIWNISDCHVFRCKMNCSAPDPSKRKLFELNEIFKSIPSIGRGNSECSRINPSVPCTSGIWNLTDDILINILSTLDPIDLVRVASTCHHLKSLAAPIMPCMKLKLFPHQQAAVEWMLQREQVTKILPHPLYMHFLTEDKFPFYVNAVSGVIVTDSVPTIKDFHGGMFCDEPGLGKTISALSLILKTQETMAEPPDGVQVIWCMNNHDQRCGYYELKGNSTAVGKRAVGTGSRRGQITLGDVTPKATLKFSLRRRSDPGPDRRMDNVKKNIFLTSSSASELSKGPEVKRNTSKRKNSSGHSFIEEPASMLTGSRETGKKPRESIDNLAPHESWIQCEACRKWRKLEDISLVKTNSAWFCSMNNDPSYQRCSVPEEAWDHHQPIMYLPGFHTKGTSGGQEENISFFISVLKKNYALMNAETKKALTWLVKLSPDKLAEMETIGLVHPLLNIRLSRTGDEREFHKIFEAFGLVKKLQKGTTRWYYPANLEHLVLDLDALRIALCEPLDSIRLYLSRATLVVVPSNLVDHWKTQIQKHVKPNQLRVYVWADNKKPSAHNLAWDYDVIITTFSRLSAEWNPHKRSVFMQIHWFRVLLDEGHTLGFSLSLTNKLQMAISLTASNRWLLTGTPTPNTPNSQFSNLQPMLKFLHEEAYGQDQKSWEAGILRPFEAEMEEGRSRLLQLLQRCMISSRKDDLQTIPPCIKKVFFLDFTEEHAKSYNELVVTVRRNILMADWNDPSHVESLLNPKQWKFRSNTIRNVRLSCCVAGHIKVTHAGIDIQETMDMLVENGLVPMSEEYAFIKYNLQHGGNCMRCKEWCRLPVITPCRHLLCLNCVSLDSEKCSFPNCNNPYEMQSPEILTRPENPNPKWPVPQDLIELQPSYKQDEWNPDWQSTSSSKVAYLVRRLKEIQEADGIIGHCADTDCSTIVTSEKVIIFSQFLEHIHVIEQQLTFAGIKFVGMYSPMPSTYKMKALVTFQNDTSCMALLMDGSAALGLDLSFVTRVFLMEPIWDRSTEEQVISRAHRMGARRPINVETLAMRGTIEEQMLNFLQDADKCRMVLKEDFGNPCMDGARSHRTLHDIAESNYLAKLNFVCIRPQL